MKAVTIVILTAAILSAVQAVGQFYIPKAYFIIDDAGHESAHVPLRRLARSYNSGAYPIASASAKADASGGGHASATANANSGGHGGGWYPGVSYGGGYGGGHASGAGGAHAGGLGHPSLGSGGTSLSFSRSGSVHGKSVSAETNVSVDAHGNGFVSQTANVH